MTWRWINVDAPSRLPIGAARVSDGHGYDPHWIPAQAHVL